MNIISIDPGKGNVGVFTRIDKKEDSVLIHPSHWLTLGESLQYIFENLGEILDKNVIDCAFMEGYSLNTKNYLSVMIFCEAFGVIRLALQLRNIPVILIHSGTWKSLTGIKIKKNEKKKEYLQAIKTKYGKHFDSIDKADAYLIYKAAQILAKKTDNLTPEMRRIRKEIECVINHRRDDSK